MTPDVFLHHVHLVTQDMATTCDFYIRHFGGKIVFDDDIDGDRNVFMTIGKGRIHFFQSKNQPPKDRNAFHHLGMMVEDLPTFARGLREAGVPVTDLVETPGGGFAMTAAPDNVKIELFQVKDPKSRSFFLDPA